LFAATAVPASLFIAAGLTRTFGHSPVAALLIASVLSPCSTSDALFARALFSEPKSQLAFVVAAQCLDLRQWFLLRRVFGLRRAGLAFACSVGALFLGAALV
jgi:uncharacterized membrane protein YraQ (UPF0718 family)